MNIIYVLFAADRFVHLHIKFDVCLIKDTRFCHRSNIVSIYRRPAGPVELYTVFSGAVHIKIMRIRIGVFFIALLQTRLAQEAVEIESDSACIPQLLHPLGHIHNIRRHLIAQAGLQAPHRLTPLHLLEVEVEAYLRHVVSAIHGESIAAVGSSGYIPFPADLTDAPVILKHLRRVGFAVVAEQDPSAGAPLHIDIQALCVDELEVVHMAAPGGGVGPGIFDRKGNIPGGVDGECDRLNQGTHISVAVAADNIQRSILQNRCVFRHDGIVGAGFPGGARRDDTELPVSAQLKGTAAVHASLRLGQIDHRAGRTVLRAVGGLVLIPGAVAEGDIDAVGHHQPQIDAGGIQGG